MKLFLSLILMSCLCTGCALQSVENSNHNLAIVPLSVGNVWHFTDGEGHEYTSEVLRQEVRFDAEWFVLRELDDDSIFWVRNSKAGQMELIDPEVDDIYLAIKYPVSSEETYKVADQTMSVRPNVVVSVPAGTFNTYEYLFTVDDTENDIRTWYAPGVGPVKYQDNDTFYELVNYHLNSN